MKVRSILSGAFAALLLILPVKASAQAVLAWEVSKYDISVALPTDSGSDREADITVNLDLRNRTSRPFDSITLRISEFAKVSSVSAGGTGIDFRTGEEKVTENQKLQRIVLKVTPVNAGSAIRLSIKYKLNVKENSGLLALSPVGTQMLPLSFWYPTPTSWYFNEGSDFAPFELSVSGLGDRTFLSSGSQTESGFSNTISGMPFLITGKWQKTVSGGIEVYAPDGAETANGRAGEFADLAKGAKEYAEKALGQTISVPIRIVGVNRGSGFSESGTVFVDRGAFTTRTMDSKTAAAISEGIMKTALGNVVGVRGAGYGVIREGYSRFLSNRFLEEKFGTDVSRILRLKQIASYTAIADKDSPLSIVSPVDGYFYSANGNKGAMIWNYLYRKYGDDFYGIMRSISEDGKLTLAEVRESFNGEKAFLDYSLDRVTEMNLMIGTPIESGNVTKSQLRNLGELDANVKVSAFDSKGAEKSIQVLIPAKGFAEAVFETGSGIDRVEVDPDRIYTQLNYSDDVAPREIQESDPILFIKREFDRQKFEAAEKNALVVLRRWPAYDDARVFLARSYLALNRITEAKVEFENVLASRIPSPQSIGWSLVGLAEIAKKTGQTAEAARLYKEAIRADADYGATLAARRGRADAGSGTAIPAEVSQFFSAFDKAVVANSKKDVEALIQSGEISRFSISVAGQAQTWQTNVIAVDEVDSSSILVETNVTLKLLNREVERGLAVFRLSRVGSGLKITGVEVFEVS